MLLSHGPERQHIAVRRNTILALAIGISVLGIFSSGQADILRHYAGVHSRSGHVVGIDDQGRIGVLFMEGEAPVVGERGVVVRAQPRELYVASIRVSVIRGSRAVVERVDGSLPIMRGDHVFVGPPPKVLPDSVTQRASEPDTRTPREVRVMETVKGQPVRPIAPQEDRAGSASQRLWDVQLFHEMQRLYQAPQVCYRVRRGDTLSRIARRTGVTVGQIMEWNGLTNSLIIPDTLLALSESHANIYAPVLGMRARHERIKPNINVWLSLQSRRSEGNHPLFIPVFFEFDSSAIFAGYQLRAIESVAQYLVQRRHKYVVLHAHCDERGSYAHNRWLGDRRATAVAQRLISMGVEGDRVFIINHANRNPLSQSSNEESWQLNRRVHFEVR